jgi:transcriptional regulator with XRE-family HTH domain
MSQDSTGDRLRRRLVEIRKRRGLSQADLSAALDEVGVRLHPTAIAKIESGKRAVTIDEVLALACVLNMSPLDLLLPLDPMTPVEITPRVAYGAAWVRDWIKGVGPLPRATTEAEYRADEIAYFAEASEWDQRVHRAAMDPIMLAIRVELESSARDAVLTAQGVAPRDDIRPAVVATALRNAAARVAQYAELLAQRLDQLAVKERQAFQRSGTGNAEGKRQIT